MVRQHLGEEMEPEEQEQPDKDIADAPEDFGVDL